MSPRFRAFTVAAGAAAGMASMSAVAVSTNYEGPLLMPPAGCNFAAVTIPDTRPVPRPVFLTGGGTPAQGRVVSSLGTLPRSRMVAFSYNYTGLDQRVPPYFAGVFLIYRTRVVVSTGAAWNSPVVYDTTVDLTGNPNNVAGSSTALEGPLAIGVPFAPSWALSIVSEGYQQVTPGAPWKLAKVGWTCTVPINATTVPPVFTQ